jgi:hypothetical protein
MTHLGLAISSGRALLKANVLRLSPQGATRWPSGTIVNESRREPP